MKLLAGLPDPITIFEGLGPLGENISDPFLTFESTISLIIGVTTVCAGLWFLLHIFIGAFSWLTSSGEKQALENAKKRLVHAVVGLFIVVAAYAFIALVGAVLGLDILNVAETIKNLVNPASPPSGGPGRR